MSGLVEQFMEGIAAPPLAVDQFTHGRADQFGRDLARLREMDCANETRRESAASPVKAGSVDQYPDHLSVAPVREGRVEAVAKVLYTELTLQANQADGLPVEYPSWADLEDDERADVLAMAEQVLAALAAIEGEEG